MIKICYIFNKKIFITNKNSVFCNESWQHLYFLHLKNGMKRKTFAIYLQKSNCFHLPAIAIRLLEINIIIKLNCYFIIKVSLINFHIVFLLLYVCCIYTNRLDDRSGSAPVSKLKGRRIRVSSQILTICRGSVCSLVIIPS